MTDDIVDRLEQVENRLETLGSVAVDNDAEIESWSARSAGCGRTTMTASPRWNASSNRSASRWPSSRIMDGSTGPRDETVATLATGR